jgi:hypothetical protein
VSRQIPSNNCELPLSASANSHFPLSLNEINCPGDLAVASFIWFVSTVPLYFTSVHPLRVIPLFTEETPSSASAEVPEIL